MQTINLINLYKRSQMRYKLIKYIKLTSNVKFSNLYFWIITRVVNMTESIWPKSVNMTENWQRWTFTWWTWPKFKIKIDTTTNMSGWIWPKIKNTILIIFFLNLVKFDRLLSLLWYFFYNFYFQSNSIVYGRVHRVNIRHCHFSVMFKQIRFVGFGHIQTNFWSYWFDQVN